MRGNLRGIATRLERITAGVQMGCGRDHLRIKSFVGDEPEAALTRPDGDEPCVCFCGAPLQFLTIIHEAQS
jgi:hypothetical protein